ncbi:hypothetical protein [Microvirga sp. Mcv34]|uniref:hypothetical protein n=1 Tax=Microvirga sp. Mcv34 TaxID=2926016 RepID=UPI0021C7382B|nr:hypothetical protein [Microvirga sp. Mcv34]
MGGNFSRAIPDTDRVGAKVPEIGMTVHVATKLNRSHLIHGKRTYILPALGRTELDIQNGNKQTVTVEDSFSMVHGSTGMLTPASEHCRSEPWTIAGLAKATVAGRARIDWDLLVSDYSLIRDKIEAVLPEQFEGYNDRMRQPGGFRPPKRGERTQMGHADRQGQLPLQAWPERSGRRRAGGTAPLAHDPAQPRSVQYGRLF